MNNKDFNKTVQERIGKCLSTLTIKQGEYSTDIDRLHNFKVAASVQGITPISALGGMMAKHTVSVYDLINRVETGFDVPAELWEEKIGDSINYLLLLLDCLIKDKECDI